MTEPRTEAGRALRADLDHVARVYDLDNRILAIEDEARSPAREGLREALTERWLARVEWNGNGSRAEWRCLVCGQYDRHRVDAEDYCPIAWVLASLSDPAPQR